MSAMTTKPVIEATPSVTPEDRVTRASTRFSGLKAWHLLVGLTTSLGFLGGVAGTRRIITPIEVPLGTLELPSAGFNERDMLVIGSQAMRVHCAQTNTILPWLEGSTSQKSVESLSSYQENRHEFLNQNPSLKRSSGPSPLPARSGNYEVVTCSPAARVTFETP